MFPYLKSEEKDVFKGYGVQLKTSSDKNSYTNCMLQLLLNIDRKFTEDLFRRIYEYKGDDKVIKELKTVFSKVREIMDKNNKRNENLLESDISLGKTPPQSAVDPKSLEDFSKEEIDTSGLVAACEKEYKSCLDLKNRTGKERILDLLLLKCHQLFKEEWECSFYQFSNDNDCTCKIHELFGMKFSDNVKGHDINYSMGINFHINMDVIGLLKKIKEKQWTNSESLPHIEDKLFQFFQNNKLEKGIDGELDEYAIQIPPGSITNNITFKLDMSGKLNKLNYPTKLALFLGLMPQYLNGKEFRYVDIAKEETVDSPRAQLCAIIAKNKSDYASYVDVDGCWTCFHDTHLKQLHFYENVIENLLREERFPFILIYKVGTYAVQRVNQQVTQMVHDYLQMVETKRNKEEKKNRQPSNEIKEETKGEEEFFCTSSDLGNGSMHRMDDSYKNRSMKKSLINEGRKSKKQNRAPTNKFCCW